MNKIINLFKKKREDVCLRVDFRNVLHMEGFKYIDKIREYCDYVENHLININKAFDEIERACNGKDYWLSDYVGYYEFAEDVSMHDVSKFSQQEFIPYVNAFYPISKDKKIKLDDNAWTHHKINNEHHHEYIYSMNRKDKPGLVEKHLLHLIIDWTAMSYNFGGTAESYYEKIKDEIDMHQEDRDYIIKVFGWIKDKNGK